MTDGAHDLQGVARGQGPHGVPEPFGRLVGGDVPEPELKDGVAARQRSCGGRHPTDKSACSIRCVCGPRVDMVIRALIREKNEPAVRAFASEDPEGLDDMDRTVPPDAEQHRTRGPRGDGDMAAFVIVVVKRVRAPAIHPPHRGGVDPAWASPAIRVSIRQDLPGPIVRAPRACRRGPDDPSARFPFAPLPESANRF